MVIAALLAGGAGRRLGASTPKQFLPLAGRAVLLHSLAAFTESGLADRCVLSVPAAHIETALKLVRSAAFSVPVDVIAGGESRSATLYGVLRALDEKGLLAGSILLTHDAVRPFVTKRVIRDNIAAAARTGACNTCVPATDTVFLSEDGRFMTAVPPRSTVFHAQTPQSFRGGELKALIERLPADEFERMTDGCSVYTRFGLPVEMVEGDRDNIKITYPEDMEKAEQILRRRRERENA